MQPRAADAVVVDLDHYPTGPVHDPEEWHHDDFRKTRLATSSKQPPRRNDEANHDSWRMCWRAGADGRPSSRRSWRTGDNVPRAARKPPRGRLRRTRVEPGRAERPSRRDGVHDHQRAIRRRLFRRLARPQTASLPPRTRPGQSSGRARPVRSSGASLAPLRVRFGSLLRLASKEHPSVRNNTEQPQRSGAPAHAHPERDVARERFIVHPYLKRHACGSALAASVGRMDTALLLSAGGEWESPAATCRSCCEAVVLGRRAHRCRRGVGQPRASRGHARAAARCRRPPTLTRHAAGLPCRPTATQQADPLPRRPADESRRS
jgi:hypothetical protein